jgi:hypothetical protein
MTHFLSHGWGRVLSISLIKIRVSVPKQNTLHTVPVPIRLIAGEGTASPY